MLKIMLIVQCIREECIMLRDYISLCSHKFNPALLKLNRSAMCFTRGKRHIIAASLESAN